MTIPFTVTPQTPKPEVGTPQTLNERLAHDAGMAADGSILPSKHGIIVGIGCPQSKASAVEFVATLTPGPYRLVCDDHAIIVACLFLKRHADLSILEESGPFSFQVDPECLIGEADTYDQLVALVPKLRDLCRDVLILQEYGGLEKPTKPIHRQSEAAHFHSCAREGCDNSCACSCSDSTWTGWECPACLDQARVDHLEQQERERIASGRAITFSDLFPKL